MSRLDYWHPVFSSRALRAGGVVEITLAGESIALFRTATGQLGGIANQCAHRRMKLSLGRVDDGKLICPYHGWSYSADGKGESPSSPKLHACLSSYECAEAHGAIWVKGRGSSQELPRLEMDGWDFLGPVFHRAVEAPLQVVIDNLSELEHTVTTHPDFGFDPGRASEAQVEYETTGDAIMARGHGPAKMPPLATRLTVGVRPGDRFQSDYSFHFDPPRTAVTHFWINPQTGHERMAKYHVLVYFVPHDETKTSMVSFAFLQLRWPLLRGLGKYGGWFVRRKIRETIEEDLFLVENLADKSTSMEGMKLGRFDSILGLTRERLARIYDGAPAAD